jgi:hypothetical protein
MRKEVLTDEEPLSLLNKPDMITGRGLQAEASDISCQPLRARDVGDAIVAEGRLGKRTCAGLWLGVRARVCRPERSGSTSTVVSWTEEEEEEARRRRAACQDG